MQQKNEARYTYADYASWEGDDRWELIDGVPYAMSPAPTLNHQRIAGNLFSIIHRYLLGKPCEVFFPPFDVRLNADAGDDTVVQPDISIVCDPKKIANGKSCMGAPDMVVEVFSPSTRRRDQTIKWDKYLQAGVREYWMINPEDRILSVHLLKDGAYFSHFYGETDRVSISVLDDCAINLADIFPPAEPAAPSGDTAKPPPAKEAHHAAKK